MRHKPDPRRALLRQVPGFGGLNDADLDKVAALVDECELPEGTVLMREGTIGRTSYVIAEGWAAVSVGGTAVAALGPGEHVGEMAMLDNQPRSATVVAKTPMRVLAIGPEAIGTFLDHPNVVRAIATGLAGRLRASDAQTFENEEVDR
jgi:CRP/FNR family cyclic AMP-dependent transcriptional regulator